MHTVSSACVLVATDNAHHSEPGLHDHDEHPERRGKQLGARQSAQLTCAKQAFSGDDAEEVQSPLMARSKGFIADIPADGGSSHLPGGRSLANAGVERGGSMYLRASLRAQGAGSDSAQAAWGAPVEFRRSQLA